MNVVTVIIPIYKEQPNELEIVAWNQCLKILAGHPIVVVTYKELNLDWYKQFENIKYEYFDKDFFLNIQGYNRLMLSKGFYSRFENYEYILIYQLDAYVFKDQLIEWCTKGYDYIGAPWIPNKNTTILSKLKKFAKSIMNGYYPINGDYQVGNGGFSLRNIKTFLFILENIPNEIFNKYFNNGIKSKFNELRNEDVFWSYESRKVYDIKIPNYREAMIFSLECNPKLLKLEINLPPFGCHAWHKNNEYFLFWGNYIKNLEY